jgi:hypothetical protein
VTEGLLLAEVAYWLYNTFTRIARFAKARR